MDIHTADSPIRLLIVDDHPVVRAGLITMLRRQSALKVVGAVEGGTEALAFARRDPVDVILLDLRMPKMNGIETLQALQQIDPTPRAVILSSFDFEEEIYRAVQAGARGYISKDTSREELLAAILAAYEGRTYFPERIAGKLAERMLRSSLSPRELEILHALSKGLTNKDIGRILRISEFTVRNHIKQITTKLDVSDRTEATRVAIQQGIIVVAQ
ncbi:MAG TPA: response regulator transcription factor [Acidobacteriaceae bacterium]|nr:response regulator transcription factor [Acidobacteriaceae bacterium]